MSDASEPSYYEVALTNRQVLVSFILLLGCILVAFVFGVWVGKEGSDPAVETLAAGPDAPQEMAKLEELQFFNEDSEGKDAPETTAAAELDKPDLSSLLNGGSEGTTLAQDVGSARRPEATTSDRPATPPRTAPPPSAPPPSPPPPAPRTTPGASTTTTASQPPKPSSGTTSSAPSNNPSIPTEGFIVQVFSSHDRAQAQKVLDQMRQGGYRAFLSPLQREGTSQVMYRVRLGPFDDRQPADAAAGDVTRQYKLETWVTAASN